MRISTNWLSDYVKLPPDLTQLANQMTNAGINVEQVEQNKIDHLVIGEIKTCVNHPDSDHLHVCQVDIGNEVIQIVCGASNVRPGIKVIVALKDALLPGNNLITKTNIRGVESNGMICALFELGLEAKTKENYDKGITELANDALVGMDAMKYLNADDTIFTLDLNPNRNDCLSHIGMAYEVASVTGAKVTMPATKTTTIKESIKTNFKIEVATPNCYLYSLRMVKEVKIKESPAFIKARLTAAGMRSINNVVDISNYIMLEYGQPLHFFDKNKLSNKIVVRMAKPNEPFTTLDHQARTLTSDDIVITDGLKPVCLAGVMGGENSDVDEQTKDILIESAIFNPYNIRYTAINHDLHSEASLRLEKKLNPEYTDAALDRACYLLQKYADAQVVSDKLIYDKTDRHESQVSVTLDDINHLLGMNLTTNDVNQSLTYLAFDYQLKANTYQVTIPLRRMDVEANKADIIEEIGRLYGYNKIIATLPLSPTKPGHYLGNVLIRKEVSNRLRTLGLNECRTYTLISDSDNRLFNYNQAPSLKVLKPLNMDKQVIRQTLVPSLLKVIDYNNARHLDDTYLYEIANVYNDGPNPDETEDTKVCLMIKGNLITNEWQALKVKGDFYLLKGMIENLFNYLGFHNRYDLVAKNISFLHPGVSASIIVDRTEIGYIGKIHPQLRSDDVYVTEFSLTALAALNIKPLKYKEPSKYPAINKDLAFVMDKDISSQTIKEVIKKAGGRTLTNVAVFDLYQTSLVNQKSLAYALTFQADDRTLTDEEVNHIFNHIIEEVETKTSARLRK